jgi:hypothetical protein
MKRIALLCLLVGILATSASASVTATQSGNWTDPNTWDHGVPADTEEVKIGSADGGTVTIDSAVTIANNRVDIARDMTLLITTGGDFTSGRELRPGDAGMSGTGSDVGYLVQEDGFLRLVNGSYTSKLMIGYKTHVADGPGGTQGGHYIISGGTMLGQSGSDILVACYNSATGQIGTFNVVGNGGTINTSSDMYVADDTAGHVGWATIKFDLNVDGDVSVIKVDNITIDPTNNVAALAELVVNGDPGGDILLIEQTGGSAVNGKFDTLNGSFSRVTWIGGSAYYLSYVFNAPTMTSGGGNDIALVLIPEPATLVLLAIGGLIAAKRRR